MLDTIVEGGKLMIDFVEIRDLPMLVGLRIGETGSARVGCARLAVFFLP